MAAFEGLRGLVFICLRLVASRQDSCQSWYAFFISCLLLRRRTTTLPARAVGWFVHFVGRDLWWLEISWRVLEFRQLGSENMRSRNRALTMSVDLLFRSPALFCHLCIGLTWSSVQIGVRKWIIIQRRGLIHTQWCSRGTALMLLVGYLCSSCSCRSF